jgi:hypothetical protein
VRKTQAPNMLELQLLRRAVPAMMRVGNTGVRNKIVAFMGKLLARVHHSTQLIHSTRSLRQRHEASAGTQWHEQVASLTPRPAVRNGSHSVTRDALRGMSRLTVLTSAVRLSATPHASASTAHLLSTYAGGRVGIVPATREPCIPPAHCTLVNDGAHDGTAWLNTHGLENAR